jgi:hypothetical protein
MEDSIQELCDGKYCSIDEIVSCMMNNSKTSRKTIIWKVNQLIKQGKAVRVGRGVYLFAPKSKYQLVTCDLAREACDTLNYMLPYLELTITDTSGLGELMNLQPFATIICIETKKTAVNAVLSVLHKDKIGGYSKKDFPRIERYITSHQPVLVRPVLAVNPSLPKKDNVRLASIEKILVDLVCDTDIYGQYQGSELLNIYQNATERYAVNYSQVLKYAAARGKKAEVVDKLLDTNEYQKVWCML